MGKSARNLRWGVEQRLEFIEFRLFWEGGVNRSDLTGRFGVSVPQASNDLSQYQALAPDNIAYDKSAKRYLRGKYFRPRFLEPDADQYLSQLRSIADGAAELGETWLSGCPPFEVVPLPRRAMDPEIVRAVVSAIREKRALEIRYQSLAANRPQANWRWISPHALAFDGQRWHARAFCHIERNFADFLLPRFLETRKTDEAQGGAKEDANWNTIVPVVLKPHPGLNEDQKQIVAQDYGMKDDQLSVPVRAALLYYLLKRLNLNFQEEQRSPQDQHVVLANPDEVKRALKSAIIS